MSVIESNYILSAFLILLWVITLIWYQRKNKNFDAGSFIIVMYIIYAVFSIMTINDDSIPQFTNYEPLTFFPYLYLYVMMMIALTPAIHHHTNPTHSIEYPQSNILRITATIIIIAAVLTLPGIVSDFQNGLMSIFTDAEAGRKAYLEQIDNASKAGGEIRNLPNDLPVSFVDMQSVSENGYIENKITKPLKEVMAGSYTYFAENDIIIAKITPCMENGKCAVASGLSNGIGLGSSEFHVLRCDASKILPKFLFGFLNRQIVRDEAAKNMMGASGHRRVPIKFYQDLGAKFPSIEIQNQIVTEFENLESEILQREQKLINLQGAYGEILDKYLS